MTAEMLLPSFLFYTFVLSVFVLLFLISWLVVVLQKANSVTSAQLPNKFVQRTRSMATVRIHTLPATNLYVGKLHASSVDLRTHSDLSISTGGMAKGSCIDIIGWFSLSLSLSNVKISWKVYVCVFASCFFFFGGGGSFSFSHQIFK